MRRVSNFAVDEIVGIPSRIDSDGARPPKDFSPEAIFGEDSNEQKRNLFFVLVVAIAVSAMMIGVLALGWRYLPYSSKDSSKDSSAEDELIYVSWVANKYAESKDLAQAEEQLSLWKREDLASFWPVLVQQTSDPETRRRLNNLRDALRLPIPQSNYSPAEWSADYQRLYIIWVASQFWQTGNLDQAQRSLGLWARDDLAKQLVTIERSTTDSEARRNLFVLTEALHLPFSESSLALFVLQQPGVVLGVVLAMIPFFALSAYVNLPRVRKVQRQILRRLGVSLPKTQEEEQEASGGVVKTVQTSLDEMLAQVQAAETDATPTAAPEGEQEEKKEEEKAEEEADAQSSGLGDLASLFEEEDTSISALEAFCKGMADVNIDELLTMGENIRFQLRQGNRNTRIDLEKQG